jgi:hypothetical protein
MNTHSLAARRNALTRLSASSVAALGIMASPTRSLAHSSRSISVVASGLNSPRGMAFLPGGDLYVAESGFNGGGLQIPGPAPGVLLDYGTNGSVSRVRPDGATRRFAAALPNLTVSPAGAQLTPSVGGSIQVFGLVDLAIGPSGTPIGLFGFATAPALRAQLGPRGRYLATLAGLHLVDGQPAGVTQLADFAAFENSNNPGGDDLVSDPYAMLVDGPSVYIVDGGANTVLRVGQSGHVTLVAAFPARAVTGAPFPVQSVPTAIAKGPDGALYVGEFTGFPFIPGLARVFRIMPGQPAQVFLQGFTQIIDLAFDASGDLYVLEYASRSLLESNPEGALIRVSRSGQRTVLLSAGLVFPTSMSFGPDGLLYIANYGTYRGLGQVIRVDVRGI